MKKILNGLKNLAKDLITTVTKKTNMKIFTTFVVITWMVISLIETITGLGDGASVFQIIVLGMLLDIYLEN